MADQTAHELAELTARVLPRLPWPVVAVWQPKSSPPKPATLIGRDCDRYVLRYVGGCPLPRGEVELYATVDRLLYTLTGVVTGVVGRDDRFVTLIAVRRKTQRRMAPRTDADGLVLISGEEDVDGRLMDVGPAGFGFLHWEELEVGSQLETVLNVGSTAIASMALVRNVKVRGEGLTRVGCSFLVISDEHRALLRSVATGTAINRRDRADCGYSRGASRWWGFAT
jgi:hypothetical protein